MLKSDVVAVLEMIAALPELAGFKVERKIDDPQSPFDGVMFYFSRSGFFCDVIRVADFYLDDCDGPGREQWMLQGSDLETGDIDFLLGGLVPDEARFTIVPILLAYLPGGV